jgi:microsomal dipeptidase-like Zn-dependent dipeptidase
MRSLSLPVSSPDQLFFLQELDGGDRPFAVVTSHCNAKAVQFVKADSIDHTRLAIAENNGFANQLGFRLVERL